MFGEHWVPVLLYWEAKTAVFFHYANSQFTDTISTELTDKLKRLGKSDNWTIVDYFSSDSKPVCGPTESCECWIRSERNIFPQICPDNFYAALKSVTILKVLSSAYIISSTSWLSRHEMQWNKHIMRGYSQTRTLEYLPLVG
jgi:hypothetical protein